MLLRNSISITKKFFQKTLQSFKSFISNGYEKLPKSPPFNPFSCSGDGGGDGGMNYGELDKFYTDFTNQWDHSHKAKGNRTSKIKKIMQPTRKKKAEKQQAHNKGSNFSNYSPGTEEINKATGRIQEGKRRETKEESSKNFIGTMREEKANLLAQKLKELVMVDVSNVEHVLDIEEVLHYYSRLTCPAYVEIVDKFFMDMYSELLGSSASSNLGCSSRLKLQF